jgi:hypothetical protein
VAEVVWRSTNRRVRRTLNVAFVITVVGGVAGAVGELTDNSSVAVVGASVFLVGVVLVLVCGVVVGRQTGRGFVGSVWLGLRALGRWLLDFMP